MSATRLVKSTPKQEAEQIDDETTEFINDYDEDASIAYIEEDYDSADGEDNDGATTYLVEYVNEDIDGNGDEDIVEQMTDDATTIEYTDMLEDMVDCSDNGDDLYNCNLCGMTFKNVNEHVEKYHSNEDVVIEMDDYDGSNDQLRIEDGEEFELDTDSCIIPADGSDYRSAIIQSEDENSLVEVTSDMESNEVYEIEAPIDAEDETQPQNMVAPSTDKSYNCQRCGIVFGTLRSLSSHLSAAHGKEITADSSRTIKQTKKTKKSTKESVDRSDGRHICEVCNTNFYSAKSLKLHLRMHLPIKSKTMEETIEQSSDPLQFIDPDGVREKFYCDICGKYYDKTFEQVHMQMHNGEEKFNCGICNKVFPNEQSINLHMSAHQDSRVIKTKAELSNTKLPYGCQYCGKEFARPHEKVKHERVHTGEKPYECELCGKCFRVSYCLTIHMRTHTTARPYVCPHCNKRFKAQSVYNHHLMTHSDERKYQCPFCPKNFKTAVQLSGHKNSHTKPFSCTECNRPFGSLYAVRSHMESHKKTNDSLKHICTICGAKYARRFALNDHIKEKHKDADLSDLVEEPKKKPSTKRVKKVKEVDIKYESDDISLEAGQSILPNIVEHEIEITDIQQFDNEEEVVDIDWLTK